MSSNELKTSMQLPMSQTSARRNVLMSWLRRTWFVPVALLLSGAAAPPDPTGEWMVEGDFAIIKIATCNERLWGVVSWEMRPAIDRNNPDPSKRSRPTLGMPTILGMKATQPNRWDGHIYNSEDGKLYDAYISVTNPNTLRVQGCVLGFLCGGQNWTRVKANGAPGPGTSASSRPAASPPRSSAPMDVCEKVTEASRPRR
jgi:uncharacterized protein (DUF2147 family)